MSRSAVEMFSLKQRVVVVTGAAGQLGTAFVQTLRDAGATVVGGDLSPADGIDELDITDLASVQTFFGSIADRYEKIDVLINNAGVGVYTDLGDRTVDQLRQVTEVNLDGTIICTRGASKLMAEGSSVINIASIYGLVAPDPRVYGDSARNSSEIYGATKAGVIQLTKWFAAQLAPRGIRVNCISPGGVLASQDAQFVANYERRTPLGRMATTDDLQGAMIYLACDASKYVTGHNLVVDGGLSAW